MEQYSYALIDGVMRPNAIKEIYRFKEAIQLLPLYINTPYQGSYDLGPILVSVLNNRSNLINTLQKDWTDSATIIQSFEPPQIILSHLQHFITVTDESQSQALLRFADPLITYYWLTSYPENALVDILGPIAQWQIAKPIPVWQTREIQWQIIEKPVNKAPIQLTLNYLNQPQLDALEEATEFRFKNKMYQWLINEKPQLFTGQTSQQIGQWLTTCYQEAKAFNLISERSVATWITLCADYGQDFTQIEKGPYQQWLMRYPKNKALPTEVSIQHFYAYTVEQADPHYI